MANLNVGMGEIKVSKSPGDVILAPGLGSCIGLLLYDDKNKVAGMAHVVLPDSNSARKGPALPGKFADTALPELISQMEKLGATKNNLKAKIVGGAQMFTIDKGSNVLNIGTRNTLAVKAALSKEKIKLIDLDTGGSRGRTFKVEVATGNAFVKSIGQDEKSI